jgi:hypothetical protein
LRLLQELVRRPGQRIHALETRGGQGDPGEDQIGEYHKNERTYRQWCKVCGGHLLTRLPEWGLVEVYAATIPVFPFAPEVHVNYESTVLRMKDGLPKLKDFPEELGGSGETVGE